MIAARRAKADWGGLRSAAIARSVASLSLNLLYVDGYFARTIGSDARTEAARSPRRARSSVPGGLSGAFATANAARSRDALARARATSAESSSEVLSPNVGAVGQFLLA
jgi:hypothetical protein